ncbi:MAG: hypothetical protein ACRDZR_19295, partial [Acidimicrobiales bacterium]
AGRRDGGACRGRAGGGPRPRVRPGLSGEVRTARSTHLHVGALVLSLATTVPVLGTQAMGQMAARAAGGGPRPVAAPGASTGWSVVPSAGRSGARQAELLSVTCPAANDCYAVGGAAPRFVAVGVGSVTSGGEPLVEHFDGRRWTSMAVPGVHGVLEGVSCVGGSSCVAVGGRFVRGGTATLVERLAGTRWVRVATPRVTGMAVNDSSLNAVSCTSRSSCVAVGQDVDATTVHDLALQRQVVMTYKGRSWRLTPVATGWRGVLGDVSCAGSRCMAVGDGSVGPHGGLRVVVRSGDGRWRSVPPPPGASAGVHCVGAGNCLAVGSRSRDGIHTAAFAATYHAGTWTTTAVPDAGTGQARLAGVDCTRPGTCMAVGDVGPAIGSTASQATETALAYADRGGTWTATSVPAVGGALTTSLDSVSCVRRACVAVGYSSPTRPSSSTSTARTLALAYRD